MQINGIINLLKTPGMTSHDLVAKARRILQEKRIGHLGTLDPEAAGVLPIAIGQGTRLVQFLSSSNKTYRAQLLLGRSTDSQDFTGKTVEEHALPELTREEIEKILEKFRGSIEQIPPMVSAVSVKGKRLYEYARQGISIEREPRKVEIYRLEVRRYDAKCPEEIILDVQCSGGTYVRTLCHDIGQVIGCGAHMGWLIRTQSGPFQLQDSIPFEELTKEKALSSTTNLYDALEHFSSWEVPVHRHEALQKGLAQYIEGSWIEGQWIRLHHQGQLLALGQAVKQGDRWSCQPRKVFQGSQNATK
ncbi:tRNA pseudouridine(55) synthase TruB [Heliorestis acidaminivorans]|uniref:tRNA pseudouridine synthase B n=1 Tax=Heliorestis acidaminivorans TaxID=553427 RepID=A0A6I0EX12_9FIRM|nr:tRNA pseudouridine(55) synthase TruB [Heliorestis acidaminivorans]KAB2954349.1 tRNA pseudouridine(55) synthase TruB [Heliorestis acidaminivorans]